MAMCHTFKLTRILGFTLGIKVTVYSLLMNYSYDFFCYWAENLMLAQISVIDCNSAPKIMSCSEKLEFIGQSDAFCG